MSDRITRISAEQLGLKPGHSVVDIRMVSKEIARDPLFTLEHSVATGGVKRWCALRDRLSPDEMVAVRESAARLLEAITPDDTHWIWFVDQIRFSADEAETKPDEYYFPENHYFIEGRDELLSFDGRIGIFQLSRREIRYWTRALGNFDGVHGVLTRASFTDVLARVPFLDPVPSTYPSRFSRRSGIPTLEKLLELSVAFVEEVRNGTALRVVASPALLECIAPS